MSAIKSRARRGRRASQRPAKLAPAPAGASRAGVAAAGAKVPGAARQLGLRRRPVICPLVEPATRGRAAASRCLSLRESEMAVPPGEGDSRHGGRRCDVWPLAQLRLRIERRAGAHDASRRLTKVSTVRSAEQVMARNRQGRAAWDQIDRIDASAARASSRATRGASPVDEFSRLLGLADSLPRSIHGAARPRLPPVARGARPRLRARTAPLSLHDAVGRAAAARHVRRVDARSPAPASPLLSERCAARIPVCISSSTPRPAGIASCSRSCAPFAGVDVVDMKICNASVAVEPDPALYPSARVQGALPEAWIEDPAGSQR